MASLLFLGLATQALTASPKIPDNLNDLIFTESSAYQLVPESQIVCSGSSRWGLSWSPSGETIQAISLHREEREGKSFAWANIHYHSFSGRAAKFSTEKLVVPSTFERLEHSWFINKAEIVSDSRGIIELTVREKGDKRNPSIEDPFSRLAIVLDTQTAKVVKYWQLSEADQIFVSGKTPYLFLDSNLYRLDTNERINIPSGSSFRNVNSEGNLVFRRSGQAGIELIYYDGISFSNTNLPRINEPTQKKIFEISKSASGYYLNTAKAPEGLPNQLLLGNADYFELSPSEKSLSAVKITGDIVSLTLLRRVNSEAASKEYTKKSLKYWANRRAEIISDALAQLDDQGVDFSKMSDRDIRNAILSKADLATLGAGSDLFQISDSRMTIKQESEGIVCTFRIEGVGIFEIVPGGFEFRSSGDKI